LLEKGELKMSRKPGVYKFTEEELKYHHPDIYRNAKKEGLLMKFIYIILLEDGKIILTSTENPITQEEINTSVYAYYKFKEKQKGKINLN
jgi:hypothetical protein